MGICVETCSKSTAFVFLEGQIINPRRDIPGVVHGHPSHLILRLLFIFLVAELSSPLEGERI